MEEGGKLKVTTEWEPEIEGVKDPIWGSTPVNKVSEAISVDALFNFMHQMARLRIQLEGETVNYSKLVIALTFNQQQHGVMNLMNGEMSVENPEEKTYELELQEYELELLQDIEDNRKLILDRTILLGSRLKSIRVNMEDIEYRYEYNYPLEKTFNTQGKVHTLIIHPEAIKTHQNTLIQPKNYVQ